MVIGDLLKEATTALSAAGIESARLDSEVLLSFLLKKGYVKFETLVGYLFLTDTIFHNHNSHHSVNAAFTLSYKKWLSFSAPNDPVLEKIYQVGCHTLKCCSHEHFEDCPYYEQLQYAGDSRVEALCSYAATGDDSLGRHSLRMFGYSQLSNGMTQSRFPSVFTQIIPVYSLIWALMLYDHYSIFHDESLVRELMPKILFMLNCQMKHKQK